MVAKPYSLADRLAQLKAPHQPKVEDPIKNIIQEALGASCTIMVQSPSGQWTGSGFHLGHGLIVTAAHVAPPELMSVPDSVTITFDSEHVYPARVIASEPDSDCALIACPPVSKIATPVLLADSDGVEIGDIIAVIGSPLGFPGTATVGHVSNLNQGLGQEAPSKAWTDFIMIDAEIHQGVSGGMVILTSGEVIGSVMGITGPNSQYGDGEQAICPSNKIKVMVEKAMG